MNKEKFFKKPRADEIKKDKKAIETDSNLLDYVEKLQNDEEHFLRIKKDLNPFRKPKKFIRHGPELKIEMPHTIRDHVKKGKIPVQYRNETMKNIEDPYYVCYSYQPLKTREKIPRRISLVNCVDAAKIYSYSYPNRIKIIECFSDSKRVNKDGAQVMMSVPSRQSKERNYIFKLISVPVIDDKNKYAVAYSLNTEGHNCKDKLITNISFNLPYFKKDSLFLSFCDHEIAAYFYLMDTLHNNGNDIPLEMSLFAIPSNRLLDVNKTLENKVVIEREDDNGKLKDYALTESDKELFFWALVKKYGPSKIAYRTKSKDGNLRDYSWK